MTAKRKILGGAICLVVVLFALVFLITGLANLKASEVDAWALHVWQGLVKEFGYVDAALVALFFVKILFFEK